MNSVVEGSRELVQRLIGEDINVVFNAGADLRLVRADRGQLVQIIMNLAVNARDAMPGGGTLSIETANIDFNETDVRLNPEARPGPYVMLAVRDTGVGMDEETQTRLFEPFFTTKDIGKGTGLGLSVVYGIVKQNHGFIAVESAPGEGSEFRIYLPALLETPCPHFETKEVPSRGGWETILLVEDEPALRLKLYELLQNVGYQVLVAADGEQAYRMGFGDLRRIHLLLTDVVMPEVSGIKLSERLHTLRPDTKVLFMSGHPADSDGGIDLQSHPNFIQKPFTKEKLLRKVREILDPRVTLGEADSGLTSLHLPPVRRAPEDPRWKR